MKKTTQTLAGVKEAVVVYWDGIVANKVEVKDLTKKQILRLLKEWDGWTPANATPFHCNRSNYNRLVELEKEGKVKIRDCEGYSFELCFPIHQKCI